MEISFTEFKSILLKNFFFLSNYLSKIAAAFDNIDINFFKNTFSIIAKTTNFWNLSILIILENSNLNDISKISLLLLLSQAQESLWNRGKYQWNISILYHCIFDISRLRTYMRICIFHMLYTLFMNIINIIRYRGSNIYVSHLTFLILRFFSISF